jgi:hypothetical protein
VRCVVVSFKVAPLFLFVFSLDRQEVNWEFYFVIICSLPSQIYYRHLGWYISTLIKTNLDLLIEYFSFKLKTQVM